MREMRGVARHRFVIERVAHRDRLRCEVSPEADGAPAELREKVRTRVRSGLRSDAEVVLVDALPLTSR